MSRFSANSLLLAAAMIWGGGFIAQSAAMTVMGPLWFTSLRFVIAAVAVAPLAFCEWRRARAHSVGVLGLDWVDGLLIGGIALFFFIGSVLQQYALVVAPVTNVGFLTTLYIVFVPVLALPLTGEQPGPVLVLAIAFALGGIWLLSGGVQTFGGGDLFAIASALCFAFQIMLLTTATRRNGRPAMIALVEMIVTALLAGGGALRFEHLAPGAVSAILLELLYAGVFSGGFAFVLQAVGQRHSRAGDAALLLSSEGLFAALFAVLLLGEQPTMPRLAGGALIFMSILLVQFAPQPAPRPPNAGKHPRRPI